MSNMIQVEITFAKEEEQCLLSMQVPIGTTIEAAIVQSGILEGFPEIDLKVNPVGIFSQRCALSDVVREGDRIEIYRPLLIDPKEARKAKASYGYRAKT